MKIRKSDSELANICKNKINNHHKIKHQRTIKMTDVTDNPSYRDTHNIGRRNSSVVTYSLNSHLFFDIYAKFDQNIPNKVARTTKKTKKEKITADLYGLQSIVNEDVSSDETYDCHSNRFSPKRLKVYCDAKSLNKEETLIPSPQMDAISPFQSPRKNRTPLSKTGLTRVTSANSISHSNHSDTLASNTETFQRILGNKTVFKKHLSNVCKAVSKFRTRTKVRRRSSKRLCKVIRQQNKEIYNEKNKGNNLNSNNQDSANQVSTNQIHLIKKRSKSKKTVNSDSFPPLREKRIASLNAAAIIQSQSSDERMQSMLSVSKSEEDDEDIRLELDSVGGREEELVKGVEEEWSKIKKYTARKVLVKMEMEEDTMNVSKERKKKEKPGQKEKILKEEKIHIKSMRIARKITMRNKRLKDREKVRMSLCRVKKHDSGLRKTIKNKSVKTKATKNEDIEEEATLREDERQKNADSLWLWEGDGEERMIQVELDGATVARVCYPAIRHSKDNVVIRVYDAVMLRSVDQEPYLAKITTLFLDQESGKKMMTLLWYYRPEHTDQGRLSWHTEADVYASKHLDTNSVNCIEDKAFVLPAELYARFMSNDSQQRSSSRQSLATRLVPVIAEDGLGPESDQSTTMATEPSMDLLASSFYHMPHLLSSLPPELTTSNVFVCRGLYDITQHKVVRNLLQLIQSPVREPPERCVSVDSAMSISSCKSDLNLEPDSVHHFMSIAAVPPLSPSTPHPSSSSSSSNHFSSSPNHILPPISSFATLVPRTHTLTAVSKYFASLSPVSTINGGNVISTAIMQHHNGH